MPPPPAIKKRKIFIVDDHALVREWLANLISRQPDFTVCGEAASVPEALQKIGASKPDIAVVDISLKGTSGIDLVKDLKQISPDIATLMLSMHESAFYIERAFQAGASGYVMKRESATKVIEALRRIMEKGFYVSEDTGQVLSLRLVGPKAPASHFSPDQFSEREREVFELLAAGRNAIQIAEKLQIDVKTVHTYCARMREKLGLTSTAELLREAFRWHETHHPT